MFSTYERSLIMITLNTAGRKCKLTFVSARPTHKHGKTGKLIKEKLEVMDDENVNHKRLLLCQNSETM